MIKDNWHLKNNLTAREKFDPDKVHEIKTTETFNVGKYEWAFALTALIFSFLIGATIIKCYTKKYLQTQIEQEKPETGRGTGRRESAETMIRAASREH